MEDFNEELFRARVDKALAQAKNVLDINRAPTYPSDVPHRYGDKFLLAESVVNVAISAEMTALEAAGLTGDALQKTLAWVKEGKSVTLRLKAEHRCEYDREESREEEGNVEVVTKLVGVFKRSDKTFTTIVEYFWKFSYVFELFLYAGTDVDNPVVLRTRSGHHEIKTLAKETPRPEVAVKDSLDFNLTWLMQHIDAETLGSNFSIDRSDAKCWTPRRNPDVQKALGFFAESLMWGASVASYFADDLFEAQQPHALDVASLTDEVVFSPIVPLFEKRKKKQSAASGTPASSMKKSPRVVKKDEEGGFGMLLSSVRDGEAPDSVLVPYAYEAADSPLLSSADLGRFLAEQKRSLEEKLAAVTKVFPDEKLITPVEATLTVVARHLVTLAGNAFDGVNYVEHMLRTQIIAAIGKEVQPEDFAAYMLFHNRKLFREEFQPTAFSYAVRRPGHCPEGMLSIEAEMASGGIATPIQTTVSRSPIQKPLSFALNAAANVSFSGEVLVHGWMGHQFSGDSGLSLSLNARARQFSSFLVLVGRISGPGLFDPKYGMIVKDKDDFRIPLDLETIPSAKEFKEAISSLSPEQQRFANMYRSMQLASTLFAVCVIQIKPQLEKLLNVPDDSLTKEIEMTQDILDLFIRYQVPSDLISYDYTDGRPKIPAVRSAVKGMREMIEDAQKQEVKDAITSKPAPPQQDLIFLDEDMPVYELQEASISAFNGSSGGIVSKLAGFFGGSAAPTSAPAPMMDFEGAAAPIQQEVYAAEAMKEEHVAVVVAPSDTSGVAVTDSAADQSSSTPSTEVAPGASDTLTLLPKQIESRLEAKDPEGAVRPTIINTQDVWTKRCQANLLADVEERAVVPDDQRLERQQCFDLLDALTKSGGLSIDKATLHVVIAATHCFDKTVINTLVQKDENPIESVERSTLVLASTIHNQPIENICKPAELSRIKKQSPDLLK